MLPDTRYLSGMDDSSRSQVSDWHSDIGRDSGSLEISLSINAKGDSDSSRFQWHDGIDTAPSCVSPKAGSNDPPFSAYWDSADARIDCMCSVATSDFYYSPAISVNTDFTPLLSPLDVPVDLNVTADLRMPPAILSSENRTAASQFNRAPSGFSPTIQLGQSSGDCNFEEFQTATGTSLEQNAQNQELELAPLSDRGTDSKDGSEFGQTRMVATPSALLALATPSEHGKLNAEKMYSLKRPAQSPSNRIYGGSTHEGSAKKSPKVASLGSASDATAHLDLAVEAAPRLHKPAEILPKQGGALYQPQMTPVLSMRKVNHKLAEQERRQRINGAFMKLAKLVCPDGVMTSKVMTLESAVQRIRSLENRIKELEARVQAEEHRKDALDDKNTATGTS